jgi:hypothetical protein
VSRVVGLLILVIVGLAVLETAGPALAGLLHGAVPLVLVIGFVIVLVRTVWWLTGRW